MKITEIGGDGGAEESRELVPASAKRALVGAGARVLFYPTLLYNVLRCMMEPEFRWWDEVDQFLLLGAVPFPKDVPRLRLLGVGGVVTLNEPYETLVPSSLYKDYGIDHLVIPTRDYLFAPSLVDICRGVDFIHKNASCGKATYVHCKAGRGRSTTIVLCYLVKYKHMTPMAALEHVRSIRPRVLLAPSQWQAIQEFSKLKTDCLAIENWSPINPPTGDAVLVTDSDLEGYNTGDDTFEDVCDPSHGFLTFEEDPSHGFLTFEEDVCDPSHCFLPVRSVTWSHMPASPAMDMVLVTDADLEGYGVGDDACVDMNVSTYKGIIRARPTIGRLSCLFSSLKISSSCQSVARRPPEIRAC